MEERLTACEHAIIELTKRLKKLEKHKISEGRNLADKEYIEYLKQQFTYIDIDNEIKKMQTWFSLPKNKNRKLTRKFMVVWLNKIEKPLSSEDNLDAIFKP